MVGKMNKLGNMRQNRERNILFNDLLFAISVDAVISPHTP